MFGFGRRPARTLAIEGRPAVLFEQGMEWAVATIRAATAAPNDRGGEYELRAGAGLVVLRRGPVAAGAHYDEVLFESDELVLGSESNLVLPKGLSAATWEAWAGDNRVRALMLVAP